MRQHLFIQKLSGVFLNVAFIKVCGQTHQTNLREAKVGQFDVSHRGDEETAGKNKKQRLNLYEESVQK